MLCWLPSLFLLFPHKMFSGYLFNVQLISMWEGEFMFDGEILRNSGICSDYRTTIVYMIHKHSKPLKIESKTKRFRSCIKSKEMFYCSSILVTKVSDNCVNNKK